MSNSTFEEAKRRRLAKQKEAEVNEKTRVPFTGYDSDPIQYVGLEKGVEKVFRIVGDPYETGEKPTDVKVILYSELLNDDGKGYVKVNWPLVEKGEKFIPDPNWILTKLYNRVNDGNWEKYTEEDINGKDILQIDGKVVRQRGSRKIDVYWKNKNVGTKCLDRLTDENNRRENDKFPKRVYPAPRVLMNVIDRHNDWCAVNKHTKLLSSKVTPYTFKNDEGEEQTIHYIDRGVPFSIYTGIWDSVVNHRGDWDVDIVIKKTDQRGNPYIVRDATENKISDDSKAIATQDPLTDEEMKYELYDLEDMFKPTSYKRLNSQLRKLFEMTDVELGTTFTKELDELLMDEMEEGDAEESAEDKAQVEVQDEAQVESKVEEKEEVKDEKAEKPPVRKARSPKEETSANVESLANWGKLDKEDMDDVKKNMVSFDGENITWKDEAVSQLLPCESCERDLPNTVLNCPYCGTKFDA